MPEIGATLRDARMRERIDITEVESATKIRAKYLRALENEEWDLLPGPTFVKTFLRTYADYLGLDAKVLVEEYKQRYERPAPQDLMPFGTNLGSRRDRRPRAPVFPPWLLVGVVVCGLLGLLFLLGSTGDDPEDEARLPNTTVTPTPTATATPRADRRRRTSTASARFRFQIVPEAVVNVCLEDASGKALIRSQNLGPGAPSRVYRGRRFRVTFGNGLVRMRISGRNVDVPDTDAAIGYEVTRRGAKRLRSSQLPTCS
jgi:cytoskeleton protein RodZ